MNNNYYKPILSTIITIFLSGIGFLIIGEGLDLQSFQNQNWLIIIVGLILIVISIVFAKSALKLTSKQSRLDARNEVGNIPPEDIAKEMSERKGRFFTF